ncbi:hypothetical protein ACLI4Y_08315 [Natrialbaceae archaeon A-CW3]
MHTNDHVTETGSPSTPEHPPLECRAIVEPTETGAELCTIYSVASEDSLVTTWISASDGSYCALEDKR